MKRKLSKPVIGILIIFSAFYVLYCNSIMIELPHMTWFDQIPLADLYFSGNLKLTDLLNTYGEHGLLANNILYLINVILFKGTTLFDVYLNDLNVIICATIIVYCTMQTLKSKRFSWVWILGEIIFLFGCMQGSSGAMETQVRLGLLFFILAMFLVDKELCEEPSIKHLWGTVIIIVLSINVFGTLYSFAGVPLVWCVVLGRFIQCKQWNKRHLIISGTYLGTIPLYLLEYGLLSHDSKGLDHLNGGSIANIILHPILTIKSLIAWCANGVLGWAYHESTSYSPELFMTVGFVTLCIIIGSVFLFFLTKMYIKTWLPLMCIVYSFGVFLMVFIGRSIDWDWFSNEWYNVHLKIAMGASIWICGYAFYSIKRIFLMAAASAMILCVFGIIGNIYGIRRAPAIHNYYHEMQKYLYIIDDEDMPVNENGITPLLNTREMTMNGINILCKYNLSVYQYWDAFQECPSTPIIDNSIKYVQGRYSDGWVEQKVVFMLNTKSASEICINYIAQASQEITVFVNDIEQENKIHLNLGDGQFAIPCNPNEMVTITLQSNYTSQLSEVDIREASYLISNISRK